MSGGLFWKRFYKDCTHPMLQNEQCTSISRDVVKVLGVMFDEKLNFRERIRMPIHCMINKAYEMVGLIKRNFKYVYI